MLEQIQIPFATIVDGLIINDIGSTVRIPYAMIRPNPRQPRKRFDYDKLVEVANSFETRGDVEHAIHIVLKDNGAWVMINDGERRWRAAGIAQLSHISCFILPNMTDGEMLLSSFKANLHRENMTPIEEALGYRDLMAEFGWNQTELAQNIGKDQCTISQVLKYLNLSEEIQELLLYGKIEKGIALQLASFQKHDQVAMLKRIREVVAKNGGKPIHPNEAVRVLRGEAERRNLTFRKKRGHRHASHTQLVARHVTKMIENLTKALNELKDVKQADLQTLQDPSPIDLEKDLLDLQKAITQRLKQFERIV